MSIRCRDIIEIIEKIAHPKHAEPGDQIGLQIGHPESLVKKVLVTLDINLEVAQEALEKEVDMIIVHHTPLFKPVTSVRWDSPEGELLHLLIGNNINLYCAHTNLDSAQGGVNDLLANYIGLKEVKVLKPSWQEKLTKIVVFIPKGYEDQVREAMASAGAGWIGNYSDCTFQIFGTGTFRPLAGTNPFIGEKGQLEKVEEYRLETIVPKELLKSVIEAMIKAHPYEEVAYDLYPLANLGMVTGLGRVGILNQEKTLGEIITQLKDTLNIDNLRYVGDLHQTIKKVALCGGSGTSLIKNALLEGAQLYITGDIKYHEAQDAQSLGLALIDPGHFATENPVVDMVSEYLCESLKDQVEVSTSQVNKDIFKFI